MAADLPDYYAILQVSPNAQQEVIEAAYRRLARIYHPDANPSPDANQRMAALNQAYAVLSDSAARANYDAIRSGPSLEEEPGVKWDSNQSKVCTACGGRVSAVALFCPSCGSSLSNTSGSLDSQGWIPRLLHHLGPSGRTGREAFLQTVVVIIGLFYVSVFVLSFAYFSANPFAATNALESPVFILYLVLLLPLISFQSVKRLHDFGRPWWHVLAIFIPIWGWYEIFKLVFFVGEDIPNWFGLATPQHSTTLRRNGWLLAGTLSLLVVGTLWWSSTVPTATSDLATGDCFVSATPVEIGLSEIEIVSCASDWDYKVLDTFAVDRTGEYPGADYFDQLVAERCSSNADWYLYPLPESWRLGDKTIRCLQTGGKGSSQPATQNRCISLPTTAYSGSVRNTNLASQAETTAVLHQEDCRITGNLTILPPLLGSGLLTGTIEGDKISFTIPASGNDVGVDLYFQGSIEDGGMFGTYNVPARQQNGEWELRPRTN